MKVYYALVAFLGTIAALTLLIGWVFFAQSTAWGIWAALFYVWSFQSLYQFDKRNT